MKKILLQVKICFCGIHVSSLNSFYIEKYVFPPFLLVGTIAFTDKRKCFYLQQLNFYHCQNYAFTLVRNVFPLLKEIVFPDKLICFHYVPFTGRKYASTNKIF